MAASMTKASVSFVVLALLASVLAHAETTVDSIEADLQRFRANPRAFREETPYKEHIGGAPAGREGERQVSRAERKRVEETIRRRASGARFEKTEEDVDSLVEGADLGRTGFKVEHNFARLDQLQLQASQLPFQPWSDSYWPTARGGIANRYANSRFANLKKWETLRRFVTTSPQTFLEVYNSGYAPSLDRLSPAEKYDLLIGDLSDSKEGYLTPDAWSVGEEYYKKDGSVDDWMGICDGWAPASFRLPRPQKAVTVLAADGRTPITFYPSDIKALASTVWANNDYSARLLGERCPEEEPKKDRKTGRPLNDSCLGVNPADWHLALTHQIGIAQDGLIVDVSEDEEVWNQPILSYRFVYFNPSTGKVQASAKDAMVSREEFTEDPFADFRPKKSASIVGVAMELSYMDDEIDPTHEWTDSPSKDSISKVTYIYDLELDQNGKIIGGEWYQGKHPSMIWTVPKIAFPQADHDKKVKGEWRPDEPMPASWSAAAKKDAENSQVLSYIVHHLLQWSNTTN